MDFAAASYSLVSRGKYDVFISFRGEDTRKNFTSYLRDALSQKKVETFMMDYQLEEGDEISPALNKAIEESLISVVIFSQNYAFSNRCLDELSKILECKKYQGQAVIPVFYRIDPSDVRNQRGSYKQAFAKHERDLKNNHDKVQKWRVALREAANLSGWDSQTYRTKSGFIQDIVKVVLQKLNFLYPIELKGLVGIEGNYAGVESLLEIGSPEVRMIGICGMGGIGKTTLATALHAKLSSQFEGHCFLASVRERSEKYGLDVLRNQLFSDLLEEKNLHVKVPKVASCFVRRKLRSIKVLIVLDDVANPKQLGNLICDYDCLGLGSRVIVTTRDKHIFSHVDGIYEVKELNDQDSLQLLCLNAFREEHPKNGFEELSKIVIAYCKGHPLALKVFGAHFRSKSKETWKCELRKLEKIQDVKIRDVLKLSFDDLDRTEQHIFLDIACFLKGEHKDYVTSILEAFDFFAADAIEVLFHKSLITISHKDTIEMHDLIQEMGWNIVRQESIQDPGRQSRLWDPKEVYDVLKYNRGTEAIEGIILDFSKIEDLHLSFNSFAKMTKIRLLKFCYGKWSGRWTIHLSNGLESLSDKLRYLQWHGSCLESLPSTFSATLLVELSMPYSKLEKLWDGVQNLVNLKEFDLRFSEHLVEVPDLSMATNLEGLTLTQCKSLRQVHPSILSLHKLQLLDLANCTGIEHLQTEVPLKSLRYLCLSNCSSLKEFSVSSEELERLWLDGTVIQELPSSIWHSAKLKHINLQGCDYLDGFGNKLSYYPGMASLNYLILSGCKQLNSLNLDGLQYLTTLHLENCSNLEILPDSIGLLSSLQRLKLSGSNVESLSANITNLLTLKELRLDNCRKLVFLPELPPSLQVLSAVNCLSLVTDFTRLHMSLSLKHALEERPQSVFLPGSQVPDRFSFHAEEASITIPYLPQSGLCGFIFCLILSQSPPHGKYRYLEFFIYKYSERISGKCTFLGDQNLISDHVFLWYIDIKKDEDISLHGEIQESGVFDPYNISFEFFLEDEDGEWSTKGIKRCGVYPIYASEYGYSLRQKGLEFGGSSKDIADLEPNSYKDIDDLQPRPTGFRVHGVNFNNEDDQTKKLQAVEVSGKKDLTDNQVNKGSEPVMFEKAHTLVENDNLHLEPDWDPIAELESMLCDSYKLSPTHLITALETEAQGPNVAAILEKLETLLETSLEIISSVDEVKQQFLHVLEQLVQFEDQVPVFLHPVIYELKTLIEDVDVRFATAQIQNQNYDQLFQSRSLLSKQLESAKARQDQINSEVSQCKIQLDNINSEIVPLEHKLSVLVETRDKLKRALDYCDLENSKLRTQVTQWVPECKNIITALKKSQTSYKMALTDQKKVEDEWADLKKTFLANKI